MSAAKITPAMREWCKRLSDPRVCSWSKTNRDSMYVASSGISFSSPTWPMVSKVEDAGLIVWKERKTDRGLRWFAELTEAGTAEAAK